MEKPDVTYTFDMGGKELALMMSSVMPCVSEDEQRRVLHAVLLTRRDGLFRAVATDGRRLAIAEHEEAAEGAEWDALVDAAQAKTVSGILSQTEAPVTLKTDASRVCIETPNTRIQLKQVEGVYPNFQQVIPAETFGALHINHSAFLTSLRQATVFKIDATPVLIGLSTAKGMELSMKSPEHGTSSSVCQCEVGDDLDGASVGFNPAFLMDFLRYGTDIDVVVRFAGKDTAGITLSPVILECGILKTLIMPMR
jgi:DNA polymerase-3 subunit beta